MCNLYNGYSYRALMRRQPEHWDRLRMLPNPPTNFCADSTWILQQASFGELRRVPLNLYWKGQPPTSVHAKWPRIPPRQLHEAWTRHCTQMGQIARTMVSDAALIAELVAHRLDARRVAEAPGFLKTVCASAADGRL
jgi:hypothetical protein